MASFSLLFLLQLVAAAAAMRAAACAAPSAGISQLLEPVKDANAVASYHTCRTTRAEPSMSMTLTSTRARVSHILLFTEELALECEARLKADEVAFDDLATQVSACESAARGGDLGWISPGLMVPEFDFAVFAAPAGELRVVKSDLGWHVLRVHEASTVPFAISPLELKRRLSAPNADGLQLVDLRDEEERAKALIPAEGCLWMPYKEWQTWAPLEIDGEGQLRRDGEIVFVDHRGGRAERIAQYLSQNGFTSARFLEGGINAYAEEADASVPVYLESDGDCLTCHEH